MACMVATGLTQCFNSRCMPLSLLLSNLMGTEAAACMLNVKPPRPSDKNACKQGGIGELLIDLRSTTRKMVWEWEVSTWKTKTGWHRMHCDTDRFDDGTLGQGIHLQAERALK